MFLLCTTVCGAQTTHYQKNDYEIVDYVVNKFKNLFGMGRNDNQPAVTQQTADEPDDASAPQ